MPTPFRTKIQTIYRSAVQLLNLINQLMEFRKTETQNRQLTVVKGNLNNLVTEIGLKYKELNRNEHVTFNIEVEPMKRLSISMLKSSPSYSTIYCPMPSNIHRQAR